MNTGKSGSQRIIDYAFLFERAPVSLWLEDYSGVRLRLEELRREGVVDFDAYSIANPHIVQDCMDLVRVLDVNQKTLSLFCAATKEELFSHLDLVFRDEMGIHFRLELIDMWNGRLNYNREGINFGLDGRPIEVLIGWTVLPGYEQTWERVLVSLEDIGTAKQTTRQLAVSEARFRGLFDYSPTSLWEEDFSLLKQYFDQLRKQGVEDLRSYLLDHQDVFEKCMALIQVVDVNQRTLQLYEAQTKEELLGHLQQVLGSERNTDFQDELVDLWEGRLQSERDGINYTVKGNALDIHLQFSVLPGCEDTFSRVLVSIEDLTERKRAVEYLRYLGTHDVLTGLYNRMYFEEERARLQGSRRYPVSFIVIDLDKLKQVNDALGHAAGDDLLRRTAEVLRASFRKEDVAARIGGDEFAVILAEADESAAEIAVQRLHAMVALNNSYYRGAQLSLSIGSATGQIGSDLEEIQRSADDRMYIEKRKKRLA